MKNLMLFSLLFSSKLFCQVQIPKDFQKIVAFIYVQDSSGKLIPNGTGFYVYVDKDSVKGLVYLVTAKHVIKKPDGTAYDQIFIRVPLKKDGTLQQVKIDLREKTQSKNVYYHSDTTVDIAVISKVPDHRLYSFKFIIPDMLLTKADFTQYHITEGDEVFFTGMFAQYLGEKANYPLTRFGRASLITDEKVFWNNSYRNLYLLEATTYWGNSGAPVYFALKVAPPYQKNVITTGYETVIKLAGIMNGFFGQGAPIQFAETRNTPYSVVNFGISAVTPSYLLHEILYSPEIRIARSF